MNQIIHEVMNRSSLKHFVPFRSVDSESDFFKEPGFELGQILKVLFLILQSEFKSFTQVHPLFNNPVCTTASPRLMIHVLAE